MVAYMDGWLLNDCQSKFIAMKNSAWKPIGWALIGGSLATPLVLCWLGAFQGHLRESHTYSIGSVTATTEFYEVRWPWWLALVLVVAAVSGVTLLILSRRERANG